MTVELCNMAVIEANITMVARRRKQNVYVEDDVLQTALPLYTGIKASVPIQLQIGHLDSQTLENSTQSLDEEAFLHVHYAGLTKNSPDRRLTSRLRLRVLQGLRLVNSQLLSMDIPLQLSSTLPSGHWQGRSKRLDPYSQRVLELELWNGTDAFFEVTVAVKGEELRAGTKVDRKHCARVLVPLEKFKALEHRK
ncbi:hypothetical protein SELMODRAFT_418664 [Selaginella moellendorffii]|uniref:Uncharacterized protein n=1 Tax=Selaginella moellendorffii TaxID=88036 RepID=D8S6R8_SELML|nr:hypothetical protein SELMODRAFT_418664 [Selaginella moellendorffii]